MPTSNETRVRRSSSSRRSPRPPRGPGERPVRERVGLHARRPGPAPRPARPGSGRRRAGSAAVIVARPPRSSGARGVQDGGQRGEERVDLRVGEDQRRRQPEHVGRAALTRKPASRSAPSTAPRPPARSSTTPSSRPAPRDLGRPAGGRAPRCRGAAARRARLTWSSRPSSAIVSSTASAAAQQTGLPPKVVPCGPGSSSVGRRRRRPMQAPIGSPPPSPLARVTTSGSMPVGLVGEPVPGAADAGLHLVEHQQRAVRGGDLPGRGEVARAAGRPRRPRPGSARGSPSRCRRSTAAASASTSPYGTWVTSPGSGSNGARLAGWPVSASAPMVRPWKPPSAATMCGAAGAPGDLERGLVGLGAGVAEEHPRRGRPTQRQQPLGQRDRGSVAKRLDDVAERGELARSRPRRPPGGRGRAR